MVMYTGAANAGTQDFNLQEFEPSFGSKLHASVREAWLESYGPVAKDWAAATFGDDEPKLTGAEVASKLKESGLKTKLSTEDGKYSATQLDDLINRQTELAAVRDVRDRTPWDLGSPIRGAAMFGAGIVDPINLATAFVPWTRMLPAAAALRGAASTAAGIGERTLARSVIGGADAGISTLALEVPYSMMRNNIGDDYGALDSVANIAFGTAFGAGIHAGGGAAGDFARYLRTGRASPAPAVPVSTNGSLDTAGSGADAGVINESLVTPVDIAPIPRGAADAAAMGENRAVLREDGTIAETESRAAIDRFVESQPEADRINLVDETGALTPEGQRRITAASVARNYGDTPGMGRLVNSLETGDRAVTAALIRALPTVDRARFDMPIENLQALDIIEDITVAADRRSQIGAQGRSVREFLESPDALNDATITPEQLTMLDFIDRNSGSPSRIEAAVSEYYNSLRTAEPGASKAALLQDAVRAADSVPQAAVDTVASVSPETREAATRASVAQMLDGREVDVDAIVNMDESIGTSSVDDMTAAADRNFQPENKTSADFEASEMFQEMNDTTTHGYETLDDAQAALDESTQLLDDLIAAGDEAYKYSRGAELPEGAEIPDAVPELDTAIRQSFGDATDGLVDAGQITVVNTPDQIPGGPHPGDVKAATAPDGRVYVVAQNVTPAEARGIVLHEVGVHVGMENMVGPEIFGEILNQIDDAILRGDSWATAARNAVPADTPAGLVREEQLAYLVQNAPEQPLVKRILGAIRAWAFRTFNAARKRMTLTEADYQAMAVSALGDQARMQRASVDSGVPFAEARYSRGTTQDPSTIKTELQPYDDAISRAKQYSKVLRAAADKLQSDAQATAAMRAAMPDISAAEINDLLTQLRQRTKGLAGMARTARNSLLSPDVANSLQSDAMKAADELGNNLQMAAVIEKRNAQLNIAARLRISTAMTQYLDSGLDFEGFMAELVGTERRMEGGRLSVDAEQKNFRGQLVGGFIADLEKSGQFQTFVSGKFDRDIYAATWDLSTPGADMSRYTPEVRAVAEVLQKYNTSARNLQNRFGAWIGELPGYVTSQSHDMIKIRHAGVDEFKKTILPLLDLDRTLGENPGDIDSFLTGLYDSLASGVHLKSLSDPAEALAFRGQGAALARKVSQDRVIHFKDGSAAFEYNKKFGGGTLAESVIHGLEKSARTAGLLKKGGTNPRANYERAFDEYAQRLIGADPKRRNKFQTQRKTMSNVMDVLDGTINIPGNAQAAQVFGAVRALQSMAKLGGMLISSITDLASYGAELRFSQGQNLASGTLSGTAAVIRGRSKGEQKAVLNSLGVFHESLIGQTLNRFDNPDLRAGVMSKMMQQFFKMTGQNRWTESLRDSYVLSHSNFLASNAGTAFDKLPAGLGDMLSLYNIDAAKWEALRSGPLKLADGRSYLTPESVASIPRAALENYIKGIGRTVSDTAVQNLRDDLSSSLRAMAIDRATHAVVEPNARARAFMTRGTQPGTLAGELFRLIGQFKSFPVAMTQMILGREIYGRGYNTLGDYVKNGRGDMLGMVTLMATYTALGYAAMSIKDLLKGKNPRPMNDTRTWMAAFIQGGGAGIYGDFLFGKFDRMGGTVTSTLAGPTFGNLDAAFDLWSRIRSGDDAAAAGFRFAMNNTPFINLFYTRTAMDYLFLYQIQEAMNPGFLRRMERRTEREAGQTYYLPPSQVTR